MALVAVLVVDANTENVMDDAENAAVVVVRASRNVAVAALPLRMPFDRHRRK